VSDGNGAKLALGVAEGVAKAKRGLRRGWSTRLVTALHGTSVKSERYYSRLSPEGPDELAARVVVPLVSDTA